MSRRGASVLARLATVAGSSAYVAPTTLSRVPSAALGGIRPVSITAVALGRVGHPCTARGFAASASTFVRRRLTCTSTSRPSPK